MARSGDSKAALTDIALRGGAALARRALGKRLAKDHSPKQVADILAGRGLGRAVATATLNRLGIPSVPRALLVGSVLLANAVVQRNARRRQRRADARKSEET